MADEIGMIAVEGFHQIGNEEEADRLDVADHQEEADLDEGPVAPQPDTVVVDHFRVLDLAQDPEVIELKNQSFVIQNSDHVSRQAKTKNQRKSQKMKRNAKNRHQLKRLRHHRNQQVERSCRLSAECQYLKNKCKVAMVKRRMAS